MKNLFLSLCTLIAEIFNPKKIAEEKKFELSDAELDELLTFKK